MNLAVDPDRKRKRTNSGTKSLTSQHVTENLQCYGEIILHCVVHITKGIRKSGNTIVLKYICALLNSGGGILHMRNIDAQRGPVLSKHLDMWWSGMEVKMAEILSRDDICNYFDLVGNHDDTDLYLFVKTAEHLCTLKYHCILPTDTATHNVTYQSLMRLLVEHGDAGRLEELPPIPDRFVHGRSAEELKKETKQIQFKQLATTFNRQSGRSNLPERVCGLMIKYVSAFANHEGGHIYFGIADTRASVFGEEMSLTDQRHLEQLIATKMRDMIWVDTGVVPQRGVHWDIRFYPVENVPKQGSRVVIVVSVVKFPGGVFTSCPVSTFVSAGGGVEEFSFTKWKEAIMNPLRDVPELHNRFQKLSLMVPRARLVFTLPDTVSTIIQKVLLGKTDCCPQPRQYIESYASPQYREAIRSVLSYFKGSNTVCIGMECWGLKIPMSDCPEIICDVAVVTEIDNVHVLTLVTAWSEMASKHSQTAGAMLKNRLVQYGGCTEKISVICQVLDITQPNVREVLEHQMSLRDIYPSHFSSGSKRKFDKLLNSIAICMGSYMAKSQLLQPQCVTQTGNYYFLLTHDQFELLWTQQFTKELWVHGPAGAGKTVAAMQMIQELRQRGTNLENILYLAENEKLCEFVRSCNLCLVMTRRELMADAQDASLMAQKYGLVCNVIVDEVQNFKDWDGDWYSLAQKLANQNTAGKLQRCSNYFWLFMDYSQKVHKFKAGLPSVIGKNNFMLSEVSRSTKEIFDFTSRLMMASEHVEGVMNPALQSVLSQPKLAHNFSSGKGVDILSCKDSEIKLMLSKVLSGLLQSGFRQEDIAVLVGKRNELSHIQQELSSLELDEQKVEERNQKQEQMTTRRSVEEYLQKCGSRESIIKHKRKEEVTPGAADLSPISETSRSMSLEDVSEDSLDDYLEISSPSEALVHQGSTGSFLDDESVAMETADDASLGSNKPKFYYQDSVSESGTMDGCIANAEGKAMFTKQESVASDYGGVAIDTVRRFSGLDKAAVIGVNPFVNEEHADLTKFLLSLASRAKDNLIIITTSDNVKEKLDKILS